MHLKTDVYVEGLITDSDQHWYYNDTTWQHAYCFIFDQYQRSWGGSAVEWNDEKSW